MKSQISNFRFQILRVIFLTVTLLFTIHYSLAGASEKWSGVDESVVEKYAKEHGREAVAPLINTDQGDLLLFVFLIAGTIGGFVAGYYWRILMVEKSSKVNREQKITS
jgi:cobalt/nickel transport protein